MVDDWEGARTPVAGGILHMAFGILQDLFILSCLLVAWMKATCLGEFIGSLLTCVGNPCPTVF